MNYEITLPLINGYYEAGIAAAVEPLIPKNQRLQVLKDKTWPVAATYAAAHAYDVIAPTVCGGRLSAGARCYLANAAYCAVAGGLIAIAGRRTTAEHDGDWDFVDGVIEEVTVVKEVLAELLTYQNQQIAITCMIATKLNFWVLNHHTGQGTFQGYAHKVGTHQLGGLTPPIPPEEQKDIMHLSGHWCSTKRVLIICGIEGIEDVVLVHDITKGRVRLADDAKLRAGAMPAGTAKLALAYTGARRMFNHAIGPFVPQSEQFVCLAAAYRGVLTNRARYHVGARYLTGADRLVPAADGSDHLGRVVAWMEVNQKRSTLFRSPHASKNDVSKARDYDDYSGDWHSMCQSFYVTSVQKGLGVNNVAEVLERSGITMGRPSVDRALYQGFFEDEELQYNRAVAISDAITNMEDARRIPRPAEPAAAMDAQ